MIWGRKKPYRLLTNFARRKGLLQDRSTNERIIISGGPSSRIKLPCELQLPSMGTLTAKTFSQVFFLRTINPPCSTCS